MRDHFPAWPMSRRTLLAGIGYSVLAACARDAAPVTIGYQKSGLLLLAKVRGTIDRALQAAGRPSAQWTEFPSGPPMLEAMAAGSVHFGATGETPPIFAQAAGSAIRYVGVEPQSGRSSAILVHKGATIRRLADLKGRRVAFTKASSAHLLLAKTLRRANLGFADIVPVNLAPADAAGAFAEGAIDAWSIWDPFYALAERQTGAVALVTGADFPESDAFFLAPQSALTARHADIAAILDGLRQAGQWAQAHVDAAVALIAQGTGLPEPIARISLRRGPFEIDALAPAVVERQQVNADLFADLGLIPARIRVAEAIWQG